MSPSFDFVAEYASSIGLAVRPRTALVEGTSDVDVFQLAARLAEASGERSLISSEFAVVAAGERDRGGTYGVLRELLALRGLARTYLGRDGRPYYRFVAVLDNDKAGRQAVQAARTMDRSLIEYRDVFRLWPNMPIAPNLDPTTVQTVFEKANLDVKGLDWELEDYLSTDFINAFVLDCPNAIYKTLERGGRIHRELTPDGKAKLHRFTKQNAILGDVDGVVQALRALRFYMGLR